MTVFFDREEMILSRLSFVFFLILNLIVLSVQAAPLETVTLQLKWKHQFQFAGYYAALEKGYYREAGLDVVIREAQKGRDPVEQVVSGQAEYGVGNSELLLTYQKGDPVVVLAVIFQHSPLALATTKFVQRDNSKSADKHNLYVQELVGQTIMLESNASELVAYLENEGISLDKVKLVDHSFNVQDLVDGKVSAMSIYITDEPFALQRAGLDFQIFKPNMGGIDFYGDNLFTSQTEIENNPERVAAFRQASLRGWKYAMENSAEIVDLIYRRYSQRHTVPHLQFEAQKMRSLILPDLIEIGYMHPGRWLHIAEIFKQQKKLPQSISLDEFLYQPSLSLNYEQVKLWLSIAAISIVVLVLISIFVIRLYHKLKSSQSRLTAIISNAPNALIVIDREGNILEWNRHAEQTFGWAANEVVNKNAYDLLLSKNDIAEIKSRLAEVFDKGKTYYGQNWHLTKSGVKILCQWNNALIENDRDGESHIVCMAIDITKQKIMEEKLKLKAHTDPLTGATNRTLFYLKFNQSIKQAKRHKKMLATFFIDLDNFKRINDTHGHESGDLVLKTVVDRLRDNIREIDVVARVGGDEFVVLLYDCSDVDAAKAVAEKIQQALIKPIAIKESDIVAVSASIGISFYPQHGEQPDVLMRAADLAMYKVKQGVKNSVHVAELSNSR